MVAGVRNVQQRMIMAPAAVVGGLLDSLASPAEALWPSERWPKLVLDDGLRPGSRGGHGPIRYSVIAHEAGRRVHLAFEPRVGIIGTHEFVAEAVAADQTLLTHTIDGRVRGRMLLLWPLVVRWLHEALLHDLFDKAELAATGGVQTQSHWSPWVRLIRRAAL